MGLDKECNDGKILSHSLGSTLSQDKKQFYVINREEEPFRYWLKSREREFPPQKPQMPKKKMMNRASVQAQPKRKRIYTHYL